MSEIIDLTNSNKNRVEVCYQDISTEYLVHFDTALEDAEDYREVIALFETATDNDIIRLNCNSDGGFSDTAVSVLDAMDTCRAYIIADVAKACSAMSLIALKAHKLIPKKHCTLMIHGAGWGSYGKVSDAVSQMNFAHSQQKILFEDVYEGFLSQEEINSVLDGKELWFGYDEITERLEYREEYFKEKYEAEHLQTSNILESIGLKEDELVLKNFYAEYKEAKEFTKSTLQNIQDGKFNIEDLTMAEMVEIEFYLNYCDRELIELEEMILERLDYLRYGDEEESEDE